MTKSLIGEAARRRGAITVILAGVFTLVTAAAMLIYSGSSPQPHNFPNEEKFQTAMVWLELSRTPQEAFEVLGPAESPRGQKIRTAIDRANYVDFVFLLAYPLLSAAVFVFLHILHLNYTRGPFASAKFANFAIALSAVMTIADAAENIQLLKITAATAPQDLSQSTFTLLIVFTYAKWTALFVASLLAGMSLAGYFGFSFGLIVALCYAMAGGVGLVGLYAPARHLVELTTGPLAVAWLLSLIHAGLILAAKPKDGVT